ncbi:MAG: hypothetical protein JXR83_11665 [Deltaproteobacteria bacterium]|nr:hypothetical protein [Deltaproteobacteria bacterium]
MRSIALLLSLMLLLTTLVSACGVLNDGDRRYACRSDDECAEGSKCSGVEQVESGTGSQGSADDGVPYFRHDGDNHFYYLYCVPDGKAKCNDDECDDVSHCALDANAHLFCKPDSELIGMPRCNDWSSESCNGDSNSECIISFYLVAKRFETALEDPFEVKVCVSSTVDHF